MKTVVCRLDLGQTRIAGYTLYDDETCEFNETTPKEVKNLVSQNEVQGLKLENAEIALDLEGFNQFNLMIKSAVGKFRPLVPINLNGIYTVTKTVINESLGVKQYEIINNHCSRSLVDEDTLLAMVKSKVVAVVGVRLVENKNGDSLEILSNTIEIKGKAVKPVENIINELEAILDKKDHSIKDISNLMKANDCINVNSSNTERTNGDAISNFENESNEVVDIPKVGISAKVVQNSIGDEKDAGTKNTKTPSAKQKTAKKKK